MTLNGMHRTSVITIVFILLFHAAFSQKSSVELYFTGVQLGKSVKSDSILIQNLTKECDTVLYWPDTLLSLAAVGIGEYPPDEDFRLFPNTPNPFFSTSEFDVFLPSRGNLQIMVSDILGRAVLQYEMVMERGFHRFSFNAGGLKVCIVTAVLGNRKMSQKLINLDHSPNARCELFYTGIASGETPHKIETGSGFSAALGDIFRVLGYYDTVVTVRKFSLFSNQTYDLSYGLYAPCLGLEQVLYEGQQYLTVQTGNQCWMAENLNVGAMVNSFNTGSQHSDCNNNGIKEKYCFENYIQNCDCHGALYDWDEMMQYQTTPGGQGLCPPGFRLPTDNDWSELISFFGGDWEAGGRLKEAGTSNWLSPNTGANNESGFLALPSGFRTGNGGFLSMQYYAYFWSSTENGTNNAFNRYFYFDNAMAYQSNDSKKYAYSIRCLKN
jgi:uncharacterized protein (TIGR02145 family)